MGRVLLVLWTVVLLLTPRLVSAQTLAMGIPDLCAGSSDNVANGVTTTLSGTVTKGCLGIHGTVHLANNLTLTVDTIIVYSDGVLDTTSTPGTGITISFRDFAIDTGADPEQFGHGLLGFGTVTLKGTTKTAFVRLAAEVAAGATTLTLSTPVTAWGVGDHLILPDTRSLKDGESRPSPYVPQYEEVVIASVVGTTVTLTAPVAYAHIGARSMAGVLEFLPHVGHLTRSITIQSANTSGVRGHVLFTDRAAADIEYVQFVHMGRTTNAPLSCTLRTFDVVQSDIACSPGTGPITQIGSNQIGRYPLHFHHLMGPVGISPTPQFKAIGNVITHTPKWALAVHDSHYGLVQDNVIFEWQGAGLIGEDGSETGNVIDHNFVLAGNGTGGRQGGGREGTAFYFRGVNNYVRNNVAANILSDAPDAAYGYKYYQEYTPPLRIPNFAGADMITEITVTDPYAIPILQFEDNEVYGATESGLTYWWIGAEFLTPHATASSTFKNLRVWHIYNKAIFNYPSSRIIIDGLVVRGPGPAGSACCSMGIEGGDYMADQWIIRNANIQGMWVGISASLYNGTTTQTIENSYLRNYHNLESGTLLTSNYRADVIVPRKMVLTNVTYAAPPAVPSLPYAEITLIYKTAGTLNYIQSDEWTITNHNGTVGDNFRLYYLEQAPAFVVPQTIANPDGSPQVLGAPVAGLTNAQTWATYGIAIAGAVATCAVTRPEIHGFVCPLNVAPDTTAPAVTLTAPTGTVSGTVQVTATATDNVGVLGVQFKRAGVNLGAEDTSAPFAVSWDTTASANGSHALTATARDAAGNTTVSSIVTVTVSNAAADTTPPAVSVTAPSAGTVSGAVSVTATATDAVGVVGVQFKVDGALIGAEDTSSPYAVVWDSTGVPDGSHVLKATARDAANNTTTSATVTVTVANLLPDTTVPTVSVTAPADLATVAGTQSVTATAADNAAVAGVQFKLDGALLGAEDTAAPYAVSWNTLTSSNASHTLTATARDTSSNVATSATITVTVSNPTPDATVPVVTVTAPPAGTVSGTVSVTATATDNIAVVGVQFKLDGVLLGAEDTSAPYSVSWNTTLATNGGHVLTAVARDAASNTATAPIVSVTVSNLDTTIPVVVVTAPSGTVSGTTTITATATDNIAVASVQFTVDGVNLGAADTSAPYSVPWTTILSGNGPHVLRATATDLAGNTATAFPVTVTVDNFSPPPLQVVVVNRVQNCRFTMTASPPDVSGGWTAAFRDGTIQLAKDTNAPYSKAVTVSFGTYHINVLWTKPGRASQVSPLSTVICGS